MLGKTSQAPTWKILQILLHTNSRSPSVSPFPPKDRANRFPPLNWIRIPSLARRAERCKDDAVCAQYTRASKKGRRRLWKSLKLKKQKRRGIKEQSGTAGDRFRGVREALLSPNEQSHDMWGAHRHREEEGKTKKKPHTHTDSPRRMSRWSIQAAPRLLSTYIYLYD